MTAATDQELHAIALETAKILFSIKPKNNQELTPRNVAVDIWKDYEVAYQALKYELAKEKQQHGV